MGKATLNTLLQLNLFEVAPTLPPAPKKGERCKNCKHLCRNNWNKNLKYCRKQIVVRGGQRYLKKIGSNDAACMFFEPKENAKLFIEQ